MNHWILNIKNARVTFVTTSARAFPITDMPLKTWPSVKNDRLLGVVMWNVYNSSFADVLHPLSENVRWYLPSGSRKSLNFVSQTAVSCAISFGKNAEWSGISKLEAKEWTNDLENLLSISAQGRAQHMDILNMLSLAPTLCCSFIFAVFI